MKSVVNWELRFCYIKWESNYFTLFRNVLLYRCELLIRGTNVTYRLRAFSEMPPTIRLYGPHGQEALTRRVIVRFALFSLVHLFSINWLQLHLLDWVADQSLPSVVCKTSMQLSVFFGSGQTEINENGISCWAMSRLCDHIDPLLSPAAFVQDKVKWGQR